MLKPEDIENPPTGSTFHYMCNRQLYGNYVYIQLDNGYGWGSDWLFIGELGFHYKAPRKKCFTPSASAINLL